MKKIKEILLELIQTTNFDGLRVTLTGDGRIRETMRALRRQEELREYWK